MGREWHAAYERAIEALQWGNPQTTDRLSLPMVGHSFTLDLVLGFERREDAERVQEELGKRRARFGLRLQPAKTRLLAFSRPSRTQLGATGRGRSTSRATSSGKSGAAWNLTSATSSRRR